MAALTQHSQPLLPPAAAPPHPTHTMPCRGPPSGINGSSPSRGGTNFPVPSHVQTFACPEQDCHEKFYSQRMRNMHVRIIHRCEPCHHCPHCFKAFGHVADVNSHLLQEHDRNKMPQKCAECTCAFNSMFQLRLHIEKAHRRESLKCRDCDYSNVHAGLVERHEFEEHNIQCTTNPEDYPGLSYQQKVERTVGHIFVPKKS